MKKQILSLVVLLTGAMSLQAQSELYPQHFDLEEVTLSDGPLRQAMLTNAQLLLQYDANRLMTPFVRQAGLSATTDTTSPYYQWATRHPSFTNWALSSWSLEGHVGGHYLTALSLAYAALRNEADTTLATSLKARLDSCLLILQDCQQAFDDNTKGLYGFIGGQPINSVWTGLYSGSTSTYTTYGGWVPFYCQHKILAGLRDAWVYADSEVAKELFRKLSDWSVNVISNLTDTQMQNNVLNYEHGGMNEVLADAYRLFGDAQYLQAAKRFSHNYEISGMQDGYKSSFLDGQHANTQVPKFIGFERIWQEDGTMTTYRNAARNFWQDVATKRTVCIGGNSVDEHFLAAASSSSYISNLNGPESCNSNNMLKLSEDLFDDTHDARYADFYEATMYNHILSTQDPATGGYVYFTTLRPQGYRIYSQVNQDMWCCVGTGMENHSKYGHFIYTHTPVSGDVTTAQDTLFVNLFVASELNSEHFGLRQETTFPYEPKTRLTITRPGRFVLAVRQPAWSRTDGVAGYTYYDKEWAAGDQVEVSLPMSLRVEACPNLTDYVAFKYGPVLLAAKTTAATDADVTELGLEHESLQNEYADGSRMGHAPGSMANTFEITASPLLICERDTLLRCVSVKDSGQLLFCLQCASTHSTGAWTELQLEPFFGIHHARYMCYWYQQNESGYAQSDMAAAEAEQAALDARTLDYVGTGEQQSEVGHEASYSSTSTSGYYNGETYRDAQANGFVQYVLSNPTQETQLSVMCRFQVADKNRKATLYIDDTAIAEITIPASVSSADSHGFYNAEYDIPADLALNSDGTAKDSLTFRLVASSSTYMPGLYYLRLLKALLEDGSYEWKASEWTTGDAARVSASNVVANSDNTLTVKAGTGANNVALMLRYTSTNYTVSARQHYLVVRGTNLATGSGKSYLWWLNGANKGTQVAPTSVQTTSDGDVVIAWDITTSGIDDNCLSALYSICQGQTIFGLTSTTGTSVIKYIGFERSVDSYLNISTPAVRSKSVSDLFDLQGRPAPAAAAPGIYVSAHSKVLVP